MRYIIILSLQIIIIMGVYEHISVDEFNLNIVFEINLIPLFDDFHLSRQKRIFHMMILIGP